ncbi:MULTISPECIES: branched-chain amino acid ABC transporter permease [Ureibacillus]|uniref:Branched-chain amino acid transport system permease protein n=1 Tax=Ureibacillus thermosphaericus TaxID=51173 RepID=A0A840PV71_URETH|nr:branched-chain amino acid ABC transporter permease [Ureibacillus thermosphaericus]MBB5148068.1 branched-chain amino acid transport system permease protein [Ureibacillus thermosphaericus]NKZ30779.1 branched-chain amino acid ABC transporter permease [Ureibacillus thermosphaericus]
MLGELLNPYYLQVLCFILINIMLALSIYVPLSSGQLSLGSAGFMGIGAYTSALLTIHYELPLYVTILVGALLAGVIGIIVGIPSLRLTGVYLAIATLGFGEVIRVLFVNWESLTKGSVGLTGIPQLGRELLKFAKSIGIEPSALGLKNNQFVYLSLVIVLLIIVLFILWFVIRQQNSRIGRAYSSIQMDEKAAESMGINITYYKVLAFAQGAFIAGLAGALFAHTIGYISPSDFSYHRAVEILIFTVFGGSEVIIGSVFGATILTLLPEVLRFVSDYRYIFYGIMLVILMAVRPQGILDLYLFYRLKGKRIKRGTS